jgi:hypothetical protein
MLAVPARDRKARPGGKPPLRQPTRAAGSPVRGRASPALAEDFLATPAAAHVEQAR